MNDLHATPSFKAMDEGRLQPVDKGGVAVTPEDRNSPERKLARLQRRFDDIAEAAAAATPGGWHRTHGVIASIDSRILDDRKTVDINRYVVATTDVARVDLMGHEPDITRESANARWITLTSPRNILSLIEAVREQLDRPDLLADANGHYSSVQLEEIAHQSETGAALPSDRREALADELRACGGWGGLKMGKPDHVVVPGDLRDRVLAALAQPVEAGEDGNG